VSGGHYRYHATLSGTSSSVASNRVFLELTLANDGRELAWPSNLSFDIACGSSDLDDGAQFDDLYQARHAVQVASDGSFAWRSSPEPGSRSTIAIRGTFARGGRVAVGSMLVREDPPCRSFSLAFRALLTGRPHAPHPGRHSVCDRVTTRDEDSRTDGDEAFRVYERDIGCTAARETARVWRASPTCQRLLPGGTCELPGAVCRAVRGGGFNALVSAQCTLVAHPHGLTEFVHYQPCPKPKVPQGGDITMWAINLDCKTAAAFPIAALIGDPDRETGPCHGSIYLLEGTPMDCDPVAGFVCEARTANFEPDGGWHARCVRQRDGFAAIEIDDHF
jgi:hypothetical protein